MSERRLIRLLSLALLVAIAAPYLSPGPAPAYADALAANANGVLALTAPGNGNGNNVLFLVDSQASRLLVYEHRAGGQLVLTAVRNYEYELDFEQWPGNNAKTAPAPPVGTMKEEADKLRARSPNRGAGS